MYTSTEYISTPEGGARQHTSVDSQGAHSVDFAHPEYIEKKINEGKF